MRSFIKYITVFVGMLCVPSYASLSSSQRDKLLSLHKNARSSLKSSSMKSISWNSSLASKAQNYANKCRGMSHSNDGPENLAQMSGDGDVGYMFNLWMDEKSDFERSDSYRNSFPGSELGNGRVIGHYTQIVWDDNTEVGCGLADCDFGSYLVCNYDIGNIIGREVYQRGSGSSDDSEKKTTTRKTTTTTRKTTTTTTTTRRTTTTTTTTTTIARPSTTKVVITPSNTMVKPMATGIIGTLPNTINVNNTVVPNANSTVPVVNQPIVNQTKINNTQQPQKTQTGGKKEETAKKEEENKNEETKKEEANESSDTKSNVISSLVIGSVSASAAAAGFIFLAKKKPRTYANIKENAKTLTRKLTKRVVRPTAPANTVDQSNVYNPSYDYC